MTRLMVVLVVCCAFFAGPIGQTQEKYTIKIKEAGKGDRYKSTTTESNKTVRNVVDGTGKSLKETTETLQKSFAFVVTILEKGPGQDGPTALSRTYEKAVITHNGESRISSLQGVNVVIEKIGDRFEYRQAGGKALTAEQLKDLDRDYNKSPSTSFEQIFIPKQVVKLNESWPIDTGLFAKSLGEAAQAFDLAKAKLTAKLARAYQKDGRQFGSLEFHFDLPYKEPISGKVEFKGLFDGCIDGTLMSRTMKMTMTAKLRLPQEINAMEISISGEISGTTEEILPEGKK